LFAEHGMRVLDVEHYELHGGSFVIYVGLNSNPAPTSPAVEKWIKEEENAGLSRTDTYDQFAKRVQKNREDLVALLKRLKAKGKRVWALGAPLKGSTLLNYCNIGPDLVEKAVEVNQFKIGKVTPGTHIPIEAEANQKDAPDYYLVLSWNFLDFFVNKYSDYLRKGGKFIVPNPAVRVLSPEGEESANEHLT
jgi:hypothetical protein